MIKKVKDNHKQNLKFLIIFFVKDKNYKQLQF